jgi:hypothetical protein
MLDEEGARLLKENGAYFAPTLYVGHTILNDTQALSLVLKADTSGTSGPPLPRAARRPHRLSS